jgi:hypothetical protein
MCINLQNIAGVVVVMRKSVLGSIPRKEAPEIGNQLQLWYNIWLCVGHE